MQHTYTSAFGLARSTGHRPSFRGHITYRRGLPCRMGTDAPHRLWIGVLRGMEVSGSTRGAGTAVTAGEVPQLKVDPVATRTRGNARSPQVLASGFKRLNWSSGSWQVNHLWAAQASPFHPAVTLERVIMDKPQAPTRDRGWSPQLPCGLCRYGALLYSIHVRPRVAVSTWSYRSRRSHT